MSDIYALKFFIDVSFGTTFLDKGNCASTTNLIFARTSTFSNNYNNILLISKSIYHHESRKLLKVFIFQ